MKPTVWQEQLEERFTFVYYRFHLMKRNNVNIKRSYRVPWWLRRLGQVKAELKEIQFPRTAEEGLQQCAMLSANALSLLRGSIRDAHPGVGEEQVELEMHRLLARLARADARWMAAWRKDCARYFRR